MKLFKKIKFKKGFTLIEMVTALAVLAIILGFIATIYVQTLKIETEVVDVGQLEIIATESMAELLDDLRIAKFVDTTDPDELVISTDYYTATYTIDATTGILMREYKDDDPQQANAVLAEGFYMNHKMELTWSSSGDAATNDYAVTIEMKILDAKDEQVYSAEYIIRPSYLNANS